jgi:hypothetical protein
VSSRVGAHAALARVDADLRKNGAPARCYNRHVGSPLPDFVARLLWDVDPLTVDPQRDQALIFERVMSRGSWEAMKWLRATYPRPVLADFVRTHGQRRLTPRDRAYWALVCDAEVEVGPGGGRPSWAG